MPTKLIEIHQTRKARNTTRDTKDGKCHCDPVSARTGKTTAGHFYPKNRSFPRPLFNSSTNKQNHTHHEPFINRENLAENKIDLLFEHQPPTNDMTGQGATPQKQEDGEGASSRTRSHFPKRRAISHPLPMATHLPILPVRIPSPCQNVLFQPRKANTTPSPPHPCTPPPAPSADPQPC